MNMRPLTSTGLGPFIHRLLAAGLLALPLRPVLADHSLGLYADGLTDAAGHAVYPRGAAQRVGPIVLRPGHRQGEHPAARDDSRSSEPQLTVSFELTRQHYAQLSHRPGQPGGRYGLEFGQLGPDASDAIRQYAVMAEDGQAPEADVAPAGAARFYATGEADQTQVRTGSADAGFILGPRAPAGAEPHYAVQLKGYTHPLLGRPAGDYPLGELVIRFSRPVSHPVLHVAELGGLIQSGPISLSLRLLGTDAVAPARFERLSGNGPHLGVTDDRIDNRAPGIGCAASPQASSAGCGSVEVQGEHLTEIRLAISLQSARPLHDPVRHGLAGGDRIALSVTVPPVVAAVPMASEPVAAPVSAGLWTGAYAGLTAGVMVNESQVKASNYGLVDNPCNRNVTGTAFLPGALAGYLHQFDNQLVLGAEADFTYPDSSYDAYCTCPQGGFDRFTVKNRVQGSLRARLGYATPYRLLPYITSGVSFADQALQYTNETGDAYSKSSTQTGWVLGGGLEYGFLNGFSVRAEYLYTNYGRSLNMPLQSLYGVTDPDGQASASVDSNQVRAAVNYRF